MAFMEVYFRDQDLNRHYVGDADIKIRFSIEIKDRVERPRVVEIQDGEGRIMAYNVGIQTAESGDVLDLTIDVTGWGEK